MNLNVIKLFFKFLSLLGLPIIGLVVTMTYDQSAILIESMESKTTDGSPIYNEISLTTEKQKDIWLMEQSHQGINAEKKHWDKIAIVVDKAKKPYKAEFYQFENSSSDISMNLRPIRYKVSCFLCHSNGPRAIRPQWQSAKANLSTWNKARVFLWNFKIKSYGKVNGEGKNLGKPFRHSSPAANKVLNVKTCNLCHKNEGWFARGELTKQNFMSIRFMIEGGHMPPLGIPLPKDEKKQIINFLNI